MVFEGPRKRTWSGLGRFLAETASLAVKTPQMIKLGRGQTLSHDFRERLMLVVTGVNQCRYCTFIHSKAAGAVGVAPEQIAKLLDGDLSDVSSTELPVLQFAARWAQADGLVDNSEFERLQVACGRELSEQILLALKMIRYGNLTGNTFDSIFRR